MAKLSLTDLMTKYPVYTKTKKAGRQPKSIFDIFDEIAAGCKLQISYLKGDVNPVSKGKNSKQWYVNGDEGKVFVRVRTGIRYLKFDGKVDKLVTANKDDAIKLYNSFIDLLTEKKDEKLIKLVETARKTKSKVAPKAAPAPGAKRRGRPKKVV